MRIRHLRTFVFSILLLVTACAKAGSEYVGKWQNVKNTKDRFEISRNGDNFLITKSGVNLFGSSQTTTTPAVVKDGLLVIQGGLGTATITYVKDTDRITAPALLGGNVEYERVK